MGGIESLVNVYTLTGELPDDAVVKPAPLKIDVSALVQHAHERDLEHWQMTTEDVMKFIERIE